MTSVSLHWDAEAGGLWVQDDPGILVDPFLKPKKEKEGDGVGKATFLHCLHENCFHVVTVCYSVIQYALKKSGHRKQGFLLGVGRRKKSIEGVQILNFQASGVNTFNIC